MGDLDNLAVENFREYLRIPSVHPDVNYDDCVTFLQNQAKSLGLPLKIYHCFPNKPIVVLTWIGYEPEIPAILLNSHMDVVPVFKDEWTYDPFSAEMDDKGNIYARGAQDMKCVGIQYLEAIRRLRLNNVTLRRTVHISFVPDEEISGIEGMKEFVKTKEFKELNVGFALDEGIASPDDVYALFNGERCIWYMHIHCPGQPGHGSLLLDNTAGEKVRRILNRFYEFREQEQKKLKGNSSLTIGDVTTVNLTRLRGGVQSNVVPSEFVLVIDCRIPVTVNVVQFENTLKKWCDEAGEGVWIEYQQKQPQIPVTRLDESNAFWIAFKEASDNMNIKLKPQIFTGGTDSRYIRSLGIPAIGFSPMNNTPVLLHDHNEYLNKDVFLRGIEIYSALIPAVANVEDKTG
ncbi:hypothetical protein ILUMI_01524 [Ignelater luminosus]|uniref:N-acyl-aliphatic-L-amino acid amidohydrolase n=1 Tax=Ignelater luminosus TaxID=2038154 RepID=A0A8K0DE77_IGNLU|nr:hypothetical protein ILUMI_01524 [Ignelater luminosus]